MTVAERLAEFAVKASYAQLSQKAREQLKIRVLDSLGCALGAMGSDLGLRMRAQATAFERTPWCTLIGDKYWSGRLRTIRDSRRPPCPGRQPDRSLTPSSGPTRLSNREMPSPTPSRAWMKSGSPTSPAF